MAKVPPLTIPLATGTMGSVVSFVQANGNCPTVEFLEELKLLKIASEGVDVTVYDKCIAMFRLAAQGSMSRLKKEAVGHAFGIEIKRMQFRFPCFRDGNTWVVTFGFQKQGAQQGKGKRRKQDNDRAQRLMDEYWV